MTILKTDLVQTISGKDLLRTTGSVLQIVNSRYPDQVSQGITVISTTSTTYVNTNLLATITPLSATSKLLVKFNTNLRFNPATGDGGVGFKIYRDGVAINTANSADNFAYRSTSPVNIHTSAKCIHYVNANNTNPTTFGVYYRSYDGEFAAISFNWSSPDITIMEIAA